MLNLKISQNIYFYKIFQANVKPKEQLSIDFMFVICIYNYCCFIYYLIIMFNKLRIAYLMWISVLVILYFVPTGYKIIIGVILWTIIGFILQKLSK